MHRQPTMDGEQTTQPLAATVEEEISTKATRKGPPKWRSSRYVLAYLIMWANATIFFQRVTFSMVIVCMVNHTAVHLLSDTESAGHVSSPLNATANDSIRHALSGSVELHHTSLDTAQGLGSSAVDYSLASLRPSAAAGRYTAAVNVSLGVTNVSVSSGGGGISPREAGRPSAVSGPGTEGSDPGGLSMEGQERTADGEGGDEGQGGVGEEESVLEHCDRRGDVKDGNSDEDKEDGPFVWSKETQGLLLGAVYWGYMSTQVFASYLYFLFGARRVCVVSMLAMSVLTMLCHPAAHWSPWAVFTLRVAMGVCTSFAIPSLYAMWGKWAPVAERTTLLSLSFSGQNLSNAVAFPTAALLCKYGFGGGWPSVFYVGGLVGVVWCVVWMLVASDGPETSRFIDPGEKEFILATRGQVTATGQRIRVPWCAMLTSTCFWAIVAGHVIFTWGLFLFMSNLPLYMYEVMNFDIKSNGFYSMLPYIALGSVQMISGFVCDVIIKRKILSVFLARRAFVAVSSLVPATCLVVMSFLDCRHVAAVLSLLVTAMGFMGFAFSGFLINPFDVAPRYAVAITSVTNSIACIPGIVTPYLVAEVTVDQTREQWQIVFFITGAVYVCGTVFYCIFGKAHVQPWAMADGDGNHTNRLNITETAVKQPNSTDSHVRQDSQEMEALTVQKEI